MWLVERVFNRYSRLRVGLFACTLIYGDDSRLLLLFPNIVGIVFHEPF